jgi:hypothetical protein
MSSTRNLSLGILAASLVFGPAAAGQGFVRPAPTAADWAALAKRPDFNGVWETAPGGGRGGGGRGAGAAPAAAPGGVPAAGRGGAAPGAGRAGRGGGQGGGPSLTPAYAAKAQAQAGQPKAEDNLTANCLPPGLPGIMGQPYPIELLMTPGQMTIVIEAYTQVRHIYIDGRPLPQDPDPNFNGTSVGHWDGDTLVVESVGFADVPRGLPFPNSDKLKIVERFQLADPDDLTIETTIIDPEALTMPYSMGSRNFKRHRSWTIAEYICEENNRNSVDNTGKAGVNLSNPLASPK